eukprot:7874224-Pyramimonas_sp.AAC.1
MPSVGHGWKRCLCTKMRCTWRGDAITKDGLTIYTVDAWRTWQSSFSPRGTHAGLCDGVCAAAAAA